MRALSVLCCCLLSTAVGADGDPVLMKPYRVTPGDVALYIQYDTRTDEISEVRVTDVKRGSIPEKMGVRKGDLLSAVDGKPIAGRTRRGAVGQAGWFSARKSITFTGHRGLLRRSWSVTIDVEEARMKKKQAAADAAHSAEPAAEAPPATLDESAAKR